MEQEKLNRIELKIQETEEGGIDLISFVDEPAIESYFMYFNKADKSPMKFSMSDSEKRMVTGAAMIPNKDIERLAEDGSSFFVFFSKDTVRQCAELFFKNSNHKKSNINHQSFIDGVTVVESWIVEDSSNDKSNALGFKGIPQGSWMVTFKVDNDDLWESMVKGEKVKGFSVEGAFLSQFSKEAKSKPQTEEEVFDKVVEILKSDLSEDEKLEELKAKLNKN